MIRYLDYARYDNNIYLKACEEIVVDARTRRTLHARYAVASLLTTVAEKTQRVIISKGLNLSAMVEVISMRLQVWVSVGN